MKKVFSKIGIIFFMALVFGVLSCGSVFAATVGQPLTAPEAGWQRYDEIDKRILFKGTKSASTYEAYYKGVSSYFVPNNAGCKISFKFYGTKIRILDSTYPDRSNSINIKIDDKTSTYNDYSTDSGFQILIYESKGLVLGVHTVEITNNDPTKIFGLDAVDIDDIGYLIDTNTVLATGITLNKTSLDMTVGQTETLMPTITPDNVTTKGVIWSTSDPKIATVDSNGKVTAIASGTVTITCKTTDGSNLSATCTVNVTAPVVSSGKAILTIKLVSGLEKEYDLSMPEVDAFVKWYNDRAAGTGKAYYEFKKNGSLAAFTKRTEYILYDKIVEFNVDEYKEN